MNLKTFPNTERWKGVRKSVGSWKYDSLRISFFNISEQKMKQKRKLKNQDCLKDKSRWKILIHVL